MKAMSKSEMAQAAGVSVDTLMRWLSPHRQQLQALGMRPRHACTAAKGGGLYRGNALYRRLTPVISPKPA